MILLPAIDLMGGKCVRLVRGDYATAQRVAEDAVQTARSFRDAGAEWLHAVDLDGAKAGRPVNAGLLFRIQRETGLRLEVGGGIRDEKTVEFYLENGISRVILGSAAIGRPEFVAAAVERYGNRIAVGIDARNGMAAREGWTETSAVGYLDMAEQMEQIGVKHIIFTDISRDGTLSGPNLAMLKRLRDAVSCGITASGGVRDLKDVEALAALGLYGAICGKSLYAGTLGLGEAIALCRKLEGEKQT